MGEREGVGLTLDQVINAITLSFISLGALGWGGVGGGGGGGLKIMGWGRD